MKVPSINHNTVEPIYNGHLGAKITGRCRARGVAITSREVSISKSKAYNLYRCTVGTKNPGCCREVALSNGSTVFY